MQQMVKDKDYQIKELTVNMVRARYIISFLESENSQLEAKQLIMEKEKFFLLK